MAGSGNQGKVVGFLSDGGPDEEKKASLAALCCGQEETAGLASGLSATTRKAKARATVEEEKEEGGGSACPRRVLLPGRLEPAKVKRRRKSRATSKAPIKVFSADASNFMAMVHRLTGIPSRTFHLLNPPPASMPLPFMQGPPTLDTSATLLPRWSCDYISSSNELQKLWRFPCLQASSSSPSPSPSQQHLGSSCLDMKSLNQAGQLNAGSDTKFPLPHLLRSSRGSSGSSCALLPSLWEASEVKQRSVTHKPQENCINGREDTFRQASHHGITSEVSLSKPRDLSSLESLLVQHDGLASVDAWLSSTSVLASNIAKEELA